MSKFEIMLLILVGLVSVAIICTFIKAALFKPKKKNIKPFPDENVDVEHFRKALSGAIKCRTVSYSDETKIDFTEFYKMHDFFEKTFPEIHKNLKKEIIGKAGLLYTWQGSDETLDGIALLSHQDVVPVAETDEAAWEYPAFSGFDDGKHIFGRGAIDMKAHLIGVLESVETLLKEGFQPKRTVYLCFGYNEEIVAGESNGAQMIADILKARGIHLDSIIDEGGAVIDVKYKKFLNTKLCGIGIAEKGYADYKITFKTKGGHSSAPPKHSGIYELTKAVRALEKHQFKAKLPDYVVYLFSEIGKRMSYFGRLLFCNLNILKPILLAVMKTIGPAASLVRTTTAVTMVSGAPAANALPQTPSITVNFRTLQGTSISDVKKHIEKYVKYKDKEIEFLKGKEASEISETDSRAFKVLSGICERQFKGSVVCPYLVMGGTDAYHYEEICDSIYRFSPYVYEIKYLMLNHANNERMPISAISDGLKFFKRYIKLMSEE
ncbi:MAG: M20/M25/M40 family metallo-hydrolase [Candidatus Fimenecus sp.]